MNMVFLRSIKRKTRWGRIRNEIFGEVAGLQNFLMELGDK
jgi:hypothetical protein